MLFKNFMFTGAFAYNCAMNFVTEINQFFLYFLRNSLRIIFYIKMPGSFVMFNIVVILGVLRVPFSSRIRSR